jgi:hypothetical protein
MAVIFTDFFRGINFASAAVANIVEANMEIPMMSQSTVATSKTSKSVGGVDVQTKRRDVPQRFLDSYNQRLELLKPKTSTAVTQSQGAPRCGTGTGIEPIAIENKDRPINPVRCATTSSVLGGNRRK